MYVRYDLTRTELAIFKSLQHSAGHLAGWPKGPKHPEMTPENDRTCMNIV